MRSRTLPSFRGLAVLVLALASLGISSEGLAQTTCAAPCPAPNLAASPGPTPAAAPGPVPDTALATLDATVDQAAIRGDRDAIAAILDGGMVSVDASSGAVQTRAQLLEQVRASSPALQYKTVESEVVVKMLGDEAVVASKKTDSWVSEGRPESRSYREINTYARRGDAWKMILSVHGDEPLPYRPKDVAFDVPFEPASALGDPKAPVVIVEFGDYECEMCRMFARDTMGRIETEYVRTGKAAVMFRDHPLASHKRAFAAATAARCASDAGKRWPMSERLLKDPVALSDEDLRKAAREVGLAPAAFEKCVADPATARKIRQGMAEASEMGVRGTPMFLVGIHRAGEAKVRGVRMVEGAVPYEVFKATLDGLVHATAPPP